MSPLEFFLVAAAVLGTVFAGIALLLFVASRGTEGEARERIILALKDLLVGLLETAGLTLVQVLKLVSPPWGRPTEVVPLEQPPVEPGSAELSPAELPASNDQIPPPGSA
ncbi:hypothetical protein [Umezawaea sp. Da 62-37]|uniref:hypothetical protein n=1 Tax=Umezawaea sp. Da 62-37 TaxID=3075927 RepID=UPI0028F6C289|nr:hypothetical protein [Umezawaea sp. Da 62-37]WNV90343.1 hypothetical protein RM788_19295 [Umezawaea sp. Da 62-37]